MQAGGSLEDRRPETTVPPGRQGATHRRGVTPRAVFYGLMFALFLAAITPKNDQRLLNTFIAGFHFPLGAFVVLLVMAIPVNAFLRRTGALRPFSAGELLTVWCMCLVASGIPSSGLMRLLVPVPAGLSYYATPQNEWMERIGDAYPDWMVVRDEQAAQWFFEGLPDGQRIPWAAWSQVAVGYGTFTMLFYGMMLALSVLLRRQWVDRERFSFPLVELPVEIATWGARRAAVPGYFRSGLFILGAALTFLLFLLDGLHHRIPSVPDVPIFYWPLGNWFREPPLSYIGWFRIKIFPMMVGLAFLAKTEITFSIWFFYLLRGVKIMIQARFQIPVEPVGFGWGPGWEMFEQIGAYLGLFIWAAWVGREHIRQVLRKAITGDPRIDDSEEPLSYRFTVLLGALCGTLAVLWLCLAGLRLIHAVIEVVGVCLICIVMSWLINNGGVMMVQQRFSPSDVHVGLLGTERLTRREIAVLPLWETVYARDLREIVLPSLLNAHKATDPVRLSRRKLMWAMVASMLSVTVISWYMAVRVGYDWSAGVLPDTWAYQTSSQYAYDYPVGKLKEPLQYTQPFLLRPNLRSLGNGFGVTFGLLALRSVWLQFPIHPAGLVLAGTYAADEIWSSAFFGWASKAIIQKYGGLSALRAARPLFMGLIIGHVLAGVLWNVVGWYIQDTDNPFYVLPP